MAGSVAARTCRQTTVLTVALVMLLAVAARGAGASKPRHQSPTAPSYQAAGVPRRRRNGRRSTGSSHGGGPRRKPLSATAVRSDGSVEAGDGGDVLVLAPTLKANGQFEYKPMPSYEEHPALHDGYEDGDV